MKLQEKREIKTFPLSNTHRTRNYTSLGFLHPSWCKIPPVLHTLLSNLLPNSTCRLPDTFYCSVTWQQSCLSVPLYQNHTGAVTCSRCQGKQEHCLFCFHCHHTLNGTNPWTLKTRDKLTSSAEAWQSLTGIWIPHLRCQTDTKRKGNGLFRTWVMGY